MYLIFVVNAVNGMRVNFLAECKKIPEEREKYCFGLRLYRYCECIISHLRCVILHHYQCVILHLVFDFNLGV